MRVCEVVRAHQGVGWYKRSWRGCGHQVTYELDPGNHKVLTLLLILEMDILPSIPIVGTVFKDLEPSGE